MSENSDSLDETFAAIAHQWRQPLSEINSLVSSIDNRLYAKGINDIAIEKELSQIEQLTRKMSQSIDDFRNYFKKAAFTEQKSYSLSGLLQEISDEYRELFSKLGIAFSVESKDVYSCDKERSLLKQIIATLLNNAKDALLARSVYKAKVVIAVRKEEDFLLIEVKDNAGGITKSAAAKLFEADFTTKHSSEGTGMGLYMVKKILDEKFCAEIDVKNVDKGASFCIRLPLDKECE
jgi:signal transduction histidine kinase